MKPFESVGRLITPSVLVILNLAIILFVEFAGNGTFFAETGLSYLIALMFAALIIVRILADYAFSDYILKGFLKIQLTFFLFLGLVHIYEYLAEYRFFLRDDVVQFTVMASYFVWVISTFLSLGFVFRIYYKKSSAVTTALWAFFAICFAGLVAPNVSPAVVAWFPAWFPKLILMGMAVAGLAGIFAIRKLTEIMPVFREYSYYAIPATALLVLVGFSEYFEATGSLQVFGVSAIQNAYISNFLVYVALSLLFVGFGKLQKPKGIYADM